ncbi:MAG: hypothetical protein KIS66_13905 [Fimbriimonadaceae bacterium]|nr:hypothetical protein [Fimbriimonadaceae bacterium]
MPYVSQDGFDPRSPRTRAVSSSGAIAAYDEVLRVDTTGGAVTIDLVDPTGWDSRVRTVKDVGGAAATNAITLDPAPGVNLDGSTSNRTITLAYGSIRLICAGGHWYTV